MNLVFDEVYIIMSKKNNRIHIVSNNILSVQEFCKSNEGYSWHNFIVQKGVLTK